MPHYFTVDEANRTLPLVERIVADIVREYRSWRELLHHYELVAARDHADAGESAEAEALRLEVFEEGLVDFRSRLGERDILLCWKLGESEVGHWHELEAGFSGRQPLEPDVIEAIGS
jgi:hypothetical protein